MVNQYILKYGLSTGKLWQTTLFALLPILAILHHFGWGFKWITILMLQKTLSQRGSKGKSAISLLHSTDQPESGADGLPRGGSE